MNKFAFVKEKLTHTIRALQERHQHQAGLESQGIQTYTLVGWLIVWFLVFLLSWLLGWLVTWLDGELVSS